MLMVSFVQYGGLHVEYWALECSKIGKKARFWLISTPLAHKSMNIGRILKFQNSTCSYEYVRQLT